MLHNTDEKSVERGERNGRTKVALAILMVAFLAGALVISKQSSNPNAEKKIQMTTPETEWPIQSSTDQAACPSPRVRRAWSSLTREQKKLYVDGYLALRKNGKLTHFRTQHASAPLAHDNPFFLPWHRYFIWEFEEQIRGLGGRFRCFTLPYWDWTHGTDTGVRSTSALRMFNEGMLSGNGDPQNNNYVTGNYFSPASGYRDSAGQYLVREIDREFHFMDGSAMTITNLILPNANFASFVDDLENGAHNLAHGVIGTDRAQVVDVATATDDPVFWLIHGMVDTLWALRQDCYPNRRTEADFPTTQSDELEPISRSTAMDFRTLKALSWSMASRRGDITPETVFDSPGGFLKATYDVKAMLDRARSGANGLRMNQCQWANRLIKGDFSHSHHPGDESWQDMFDSDCIRAYKRCKDLDTMCHYDDSLETCGSGEELEISLEDLLNKRGVKGNKCIEGARKRAYRMSKSTGGLRAVCNGKADHVCRL